MALPPRGNRMSSHRIHTYCVCPPTDFHSSGGILPPPQQRVSHRIRRSHRSLCWEYSPTDFTEFTELLAECILPQISQICTDWLGCLQGGALVSSAPTEQEVHQPNKIDILPRNPQNSQNFLQSVFSHRFHRFAQMVRVPSRGCTCLKCTNVTRSAPT